MEYAMEVTTLLCVGAGISSMVAGDDCAGFCVHVIGKDPVRGVLAGDDKAYVDWGVP